MNDTHFPDPDQNPYHPYQETERYRAFRDGWAAQQIQSPRTANPYPLTKTGRALAWLDGWTAASVEGTGSVSRRRRGEAHPLDELDVVRDRAERAPAAVEA